MNGNIIGRPDWICTIVRSDLLEYLYDDDGIALGVSEYLLGIWNILRVRTG
jgi:hypothetical protein